MTLRENLRGPKRKKEEGRRKTQNSKEEKEIYRPVLFSEGGHQTTNNKQQTTNNKHQAMKGNNLVKNHRAN